MRTKKQSSSAKKRPKKPPTSAAHLVAVGDEAMEALDVHKAIVAYQAAIPLLEEEHEQHHQQEEEVDNNNNNKDHHRKDLASVLAKLAECKVSVGDQDGARDDFERAIALSPPGPFRAGLYLYVGQLSLEEDALEAHLKGISELEDYMAHFQEHGNVDTAHTTRTSDGTTTVITLTDLQQQLVRAHCALAELYLTDLCYEETAEEECELHVQKAMQLCDPPLVDALQVMTSLRLSQKKEATSYILQAYQAMKTGCEALAALVGLRDEGLDDGDDAATAAAAAAAAIELTEVDAANDLPSYEFRCQTAKLLLECAAVSTESTNRECVQAAIQVLGSLLAENDEVVEIWYLLGCAFDLMQSPNLAQHYWQQALQMLLKVQEQLKQENDDDDDDDDVLQQLNECEGQIHEIQSKLERLVQDGGLEDDDCDSDEEMEQG